MKSTQIVIVPNAPAKQTLLICSLELYTYRYMSIAVVSSSSQQASIGSSCYCGSQLCGNRTGNLALMVRRWILFDEIIGSTETPILPDDIELFLAHAVAYPIKSRVNSFGHTFLLDSIICHVSVSTVVWVGGWGCPSSLWEVHMGHASLAL